MESFNELQADLESSLTTFGSSRQSHSAHGAGLRFQGRILDWVQRKIEEGILSPERKEAIKAVALTVFDGFDIPYIGGVIEASVKKFLRPLFESALNELLNI